MHRRSALLVALATAALAAGAAPAPASAAEGFVGVLADGRIARFQSDALTALSTPLRVTGLAPRERLVALAGAPGRVYAIGSSARLYTLDPVNGRARPVGPPFPQGLRGTRFSLAVTPTGPAGRLLSDVGQSLHVDLATGATSEAPQLQRASGAGPAFPAVDVLPDGRLVGVDLVRRELLTETAPGSAQLGVAALNIRHGSDLTEPAAFDIGDDGSAWILGSFGGRRFRPQSILLPLDREAATTTSLFRPFLRRVTAFTSVGEVADDERPPAALVRWPKRLRLRDLVAGRLRIRVRASEGGQASAWVRAPGLRSGPPAFSTRDTPGEHRLRYLHLGAVERRALRRRVGRRVQVKLRITDWAGNHRRVERWIRLTR